MERKILMKKLFSSQFVEGFKDRYIPLILVYYFQADNTNLYCKKACTLQQNTTEVMKSWSTYLPTQEMQTLE